MSAWSTPDYSLDMTDISTRVSESYPLELHFLKALCVAGKYRRCIQACRQLLDTGAVRDHPLHQTFVNYYLGLSHDELARMMHHYSRTKLPAFGQAQQYYSVALESLPPPGTRFAPPPTIESPEAEDPFHSAHSEPSTPSPLLSPTTRKISGSMLSANASLRSPPMSPLSHHTRTMSLPVRSPPPPQPASRDTSSSTLTSLGSHSSFNEILTPHKVMRRDLSRDFSRMSLLNDMDKPLPPIPTQPARSPSMTQGLMRPIRLGSPPQQFHVPPRLPYARNGQQGYYVLPRLVTQPPPIQESPSKQLRYPGEDVSPVSPVSPMGPADASSDAHTVSPVSPETPVHAAQYAEKYFSDLPSASQHDQQAAPEDAQQQEEDRVTSHLLALRTQLQTHLSLLETSRQQTLLAQTSRSTLQPPITNLRTSIDSKAPSSRHDSVQEDVELLRALSASQRARKTRSFWSFTPEDEKAMEKRRRIEEGRRRGWRRERFDAERYMGLAERALGEL